MEETSEELPNFSIGIDLLGPDPTSNKNKAQKNSQVDSLTFKTFFSDTWVHLALIFSIFSVNSFIHSYSSNQSIKCGVFLTSQQGRLFTFFVRCENFALYHNKRILRADPCCRSVIK